MIIKSYELNKINLNLNKTFLFYGKNEGLKKEALSILINNKNNISKAIDLFIKNLNQFKKDINSKNNKSIVKKLIQTKKVRSKIIKLKQDIDKPDFGRN